MSLFGHEQPSAPSAAPQELISRRIADLADWLSENAPYCAADQRHLDEHSSERAYWHDGYLAALRDVEQLLARARSSG